MRYGLIRQIEGHGPVAMERHRLENAGCDVLLDEGRPTRAALGAQRTLLFSLKAGDELLVGGLHTLQMSTGQLVLLLRKFNETGVALKIVDADGVTTLDASSDARALLGLLAANEGQRPDPRRAPSRRRPSSKPLTRFQASYARDLRRQGASLRTISQLFQISPADLQPYLDKAEGHAERPQVVVSLHERRARRP